MKSGAGEIWMKSEAGEIWTRVKVQFLLKTDSGHPRDVQVTLFTLANPQSSLLKSGAGRNLVHAGSVFKMWNVVLK